MSTNGSNKATIVCPKCNQRFSASIPKLGVINDLRLSMAVATHEKPIRCICGQYLCWAMQSAEANWMPFAITDEQAALLDESKIIVPPLKLL